MASKLDGKTIYDRIVKAITFKAENDPTFFKTTKECKLYNRYGDITDKGISRLLNVSAAHVYNWSTGSIPSGATLINISEILDCSLDYLIGRSETLNYELNDIHAATGLSEPAIDQLREYADKKHEMENGKRINWTKFFLRYSNIRELQSNGYNIQLNSFEIIPDLISFMLTYKPDGSDSTSLEYVVDNIVEFNTKLVWYSVMDDLSKTICREAYERMMKKRNNTVPDNDIAERCFAEELKSVVLEHASEVFDPSREMMVFESVFSDDTNEEFHLGKLKEKGNLSENSLMDTDDALDLVVKDLKPRFNLIHNRSYKGEQEQAGRIRDNIYQIIERYLNEKKSETDTYFVDD